MKQGNIKAQIIEMISALPDDVTWEDIQYHIYVREKVLRGMAAADAGDVISQEEAERKVEGWLRSSGPIQR